MIRVPLSDRAQPPRHGRLRRAAAVVGGLVVLFGTQLSCARAQSVEKWHEPAAPARFIVEPETPDPRARIGWVQLNLPVPRWAGIPIIACDSSGKRVGAEWFWSARGEPTTVCFDTSSGANRYYLYFGSIGLPRKTEWDPRAGVVLETREGNGKMIASLEEMTAAWTKAQPVLGRSMVNGIFDGVHRHGPTGNVFSHYQGWFDLAAPTTLELVTISTDASFVLVDGKKVVAWPSRHGFHEGRSGKYREAVELPAGAHRLEYYNAYTAPAPVGEGPPLLCSLGVKLPDKSWAMLTPDNEFLRRSLRARVTAYETQPDHVTPSGQIPPPAPGAAWSWRVTEQSLPSPQQPEVGFLTVEFTCFPAAEGRKYRWSFGDGETADGLSVSHVFARSGPRSIRLAIYDGPKLVATTPAQEINVHPDWPRLVGGNSRPTLSASQRTALLARDATSRATADLAGCLQGFLGFDDDEAVLKLTPALLGQLNTLDQADLPAIHGAALLLADGEADHPDEVQRLLRALLDRLTSASSAPASTPALTALASRARLTWAQIILRTSDQFDEVRGLLKAIEVATLSADERRLLDILQADLALALGDVDAARSQYQALSGSVAGIDARSGMRRTSTIDTINAFIDRKELDSAERVLHEIEGQAPIEKLTPECALARVQLQRATGHSAEALLTARRLLPAFTGPGARSELLFQITDLAFKQGDSALARKTLRELLEKHPYSERAARAKQQWARESDSTLSAHPSQP